jgi:hypothetical protein
MCPGVTRWELNLVTYDSLNVNNNKNKHAYAGATE